MSYFSNSGFDAQSCGALDSSNLKRELVMGLQQKRLGALDICCGSTWDIINLHPNSWASSAVAHTVEGLWVSRVLPRDLRWSGRVLTSLQQTKPRINHVR